jgi:hypothetical protein
VAIPNKVISQNPTIDTITVDVYDVYGKELIERVMPVNSVCSLATIPITYRDPLK